MKNKLHWRKNLRKLGIIENEIWREIPGYENYYCASNLGRIYSIQRDKIKVPWLTQKGYYDLALFKKTERRVWKVHRLVAVTFIPNPDGKPCVNHLNGIKIWNKVPNLEWCTPKENVAHAMRTGLFRKNAA